MKIDSDLIECAGGKWQVEISWGVWTAYTKPMPRKEDAVKESNKLMAMLRESLRRPNK